LNPHHIAVVSQMCINIVIVISVKNALTDPLTLTFSTFEPKNHNIYRISQCHSL